MSGIRIGSRVILPSKNVGHGTVAYIGETKFAKGEWVGIVLDEKKGKNNGSIQGISYFICEADYGMFVRSQLIETINSGPETPAKRILKTPRVTPGKSVERGKARKSETSRSKERPRPKTSRDPSPDTTPPNMPEVIEEEANVKEENISNNDIIKEPEVKSILQQSMEQTNTIKELQREKELLERGIKDWQERTESLVVKRRHDREALKDAERNRIQLQGLEEFKIRIMEQHNDLKKELREERKIREELAQEYDTFREDMGEASETIEMMTLDKEMAEEQADILRSENEELRVKLEEVETDLALLREEAESVNLDDGDDSGDQSVLKMQVRMKDEENKKLKEALIKLRDLNSEEKLLAQQSVKQAKTAHEELDIKNKLVRKYEDRTNVLEGEVEELKEQVDLALGAEEMVEQLTTRILDLDEKLKEETERANDMEELHELDAEMAEAARETELELREEIDISQMKMRELTKLLESERAHSADLQQTIRKFRTALDDMRDHNEQLKEEAKRDQERGEGDGSEDTPEKPVDITERIIERRNHSAQVELDLRKLQIEVLNSQVSMLNLFLPKTFHTRGGDSDGVNIELLFLRMSNKARIIQTHAFEKFSLDKPTGNPIVSESQAWASELCDILEILRCYTENFSEILGQCSIETWKRIGTLYPDVLPNESGLDYFIDLVRRDTLDETVSLINLNKSIGFISHVHGVHFSREHEDHGRFIFRFGRRGNTLSTRLAASTARLQSLVLPGQELSDSAKLLTDIIARLPSLKQTFRRIQRFAPEINLGHISIEERNGCRDAIQHVNIIADFLQYWSQTSHNLAVQLDQKFLPEKQLHDAAVQACNKVYGPGNEGFASVRNSITSSFPFIAQINTRLQEGYYQPKNSVVEEIEPAVSRRAEKQQPQTPEELQVHMEDRDTVIKEIRQALRVKSDEAEQQKLRADMVEVRSERVNLEGEEKRRKLQSEVKQLQAALETKEKEYEITVDAFKQDIKMLKAEKSSLQSQRQKLMNKPNVIERLGVSRSALSPDVNIKSSVEEFGAMLRQKLSSEKKYVPHPCVEAQASAMVQDSPLLCDQIKSLSHSVNHLQRRLIKSEGKSMKTRVNNLPPIQRLNNSSPALNAISRKIEDATAPILRPSKLIKIGQPQPAMLLLASQLHTKAKCIERLPVLESELMQTYAAAEGKLNTTSIGGLTTSKLFNQTWDGSGSLFAEIWTEENNKPEKMFLNEDDAINFTRLLQPCT